MRKVLRKRGGRVGILVVASLNLLAIPMASAGNPRVETGRYKECRAPYGRCEGVVRNGSIIKIIDQRRYRFKRESEWRKGRYFLNDEYRIRFTTGPLHNQLSNEDYRCTYYGDIMCDHRHIYDFYRGWKHVDSD